MSIDPRRTQPFPTCECLNKPCRCSRWPDYRNRWGLPVNGGGDVPCCWLDFDGANTTVSCGADANLANLPAEVTGFTWDGWVMHRSYGEGGFGHEVSKGSAGAPGFRFWWYGVGGFEWRVFFPTAAISRVAMVPDSAWHHKTAYLNPADNKIYVAIDGTWAGAYILQNAGAGIYANDSAVNLGLGCRGTGLANSMDGLMGWQRASTGNRHGYPANFTAPERCTMPTVDATTKEIWNFDEGAGAVVAAQVDNGDNGAIVSGTWGCE